MGDNHLDNLADQDAGGDPIAPVDLQPEVQELLGGAALDLDHGKPGLPPGEAPGKYQAYTVKLREIIGKIASGECKVKKHGALQRTLTRVYTEGVLRDAKAKGRLTDMAQRARVAYEKGAFAEARIMNEMGRKRANPCAIRTSAAVSDMLIKWVRGMGDGARMTRRAVRFQVLILRAEYVKQCSEAGEQPDSFPTSHRGVNGWIKSFLSRYSLSWRAPNKAYKLKLEVWEQRVLIWFRNSIKVRYFLSKGNTGEGVPFVTFDETPLWRDEVQKDQVLAEKGAKAVATKAKAEDSRNRSTVVLFLASPSIALPLPRLVFKALTPGGTIRKNLDAETQGAPESRIEYSFTKTGSVLAKTMELIQSDLKRTPGPLARMAATKDSRGFVVAIFDSAEQHKTWESEEWANMLRQGIFPLRLAGGATTACQALDVQGNKGFRAACRDMQTEQELAAIAAGAAYVKTTRRQILQRALHGHNTAIKTVDTARLFRRIGATNSFCGKDDGELDSSIRHVWEKFNMCAWRESFLAENKGAEMSAEALYLSLETATNVATANAIPCEADVEPSESEGDCSTDDEDGLPEEKKKAVVPKKRPHGGLEEALSLNGGEDSPRLTALIGRYVRTKKLELAQMGSAGSGHGADQQ